MSPFSKQAGHRLPGTGSWGSPKGWGPSDPLPLPLFCKGKLVTGPVLSSENAAFLFLLLSVPVIPHPVPSSENAASIFLLLPVAVVPVPVPVGPVLYKGKLVNAWGLGELYKPPAFWENTIAPVVIIIRILISDVI